MATPIPGEPRADIPDWASGVRSLVVLSGAGISTDSGIPDFRGPSGAWTLNPGAEKRHTYQAFMADAGLRRSYWKSRAEHPAWTARPNRAHLAVASLTGSGIDATIVTQNTDGLHQRAGSPASRVLELHGTMHETVCVGCGDRMATTQVLTRIAAGEATPPCARCGGILKTASTMFGQTMNPEVFARARQAITTCDLVLAVGTSLTVEPAASLCASAVRAGATLVIINRDPTPYDVIATSVIRQPLGEALPRVVQQLRGARDCPADRPGPPRAGVGVGAPFIPSPRQLLRAGARTARFRSRVAELERLMAWCADGQALAHLLWGPSGIGKSRLAIEFADRLAAAGGWDVEFLASGAHLIASRRPLLVVVEDAETRREQVIQVLRAARDRPPAERVRLLLLARGRDGWWDELRSEVDTSEELGVPDETRPDRADAVRDAARDYAAALGALGWPGSQPDRTFLMRFSDGPHRPGMLQASVLAGLLGGPGHPVSMLVGHEIDHMWRRSAEFGLDLPAGEIADAMAVASLCGATDEAAALAALGGIPALRDIGVRTRAARWLHEQYPSRPGQSGYWDQSLPDSLAEDLITAVVTPRLLLRTLTETTPEQDRRAFTVLARAADTRPALRLCLTELLSLLPGLSPAAVDAAVNGGYPAPLAAALTSLATNVPLPAELLDAVPAGGTVLGEFPVVLAESLIETYEQRAKSENGLRGLTRTLIELAGRLADLGRAEQALEVARRSVETAAGLTDPRDYPAQAEECLRRASALAQR
jgi:NAD-dependent SIR2 family protein deacetylase